MLKIIPYTLLKKKKIQKKKNKKKRKYIRKSLNIIKLNILRRKQNLKLRLMKTASMKLEKKNKKQEVKEHISSVMLEIIITKRTTIKTKMTENSKTIRLKKVERRKMLKKQIKQKKLRL